MNVERSTIPRRQLLLNDSFLIAIMGLLAACGLIYEYLLAHYAGRVLGTVETAIYGMIGLMIVAMGIGSFAARGIRNPFSAFAWLEVTIAFLGVTCILFIASLVAITTILPQVIADAFLLPPDLHPEGGIFRTLKTIAVNSPYFLGFVLGFFIGMEIPLIARVREAVHGVHLSHNTGTIYGVDYIGAGLGALVWVAIMLSMDITRAAVLTAIANLLAGLLFIGWYHKKINLVKPMLATHALVAVLAFVVLAKGEDWTRDMSNLLYRDEVVFDRNTHYQHLAITRRYVGNLEPVYGFFINGRLQFSSHDEHIYHSMLVTPAAVAAEKTDRVLIVGGGDGLALRNILKWHPREVVLIDLDDAVIDFFSDTGGEKLPSYRQALVALNEHAFSDDRVAVRIADAFIEIDQLLKAGELFDVIIVDLPDPSHPDLNRLYSDNFYGRLRHLLTGGGAMTVQSTSPYHAKQAFISIGLTIAEAGFQHVEQYRQNIPSFGEWGFTIATKQGINPRDKFNRINEIEQDDWLSPGLLRASFEFPVGYFDEIDSIEVNRLGTNTIFEYHHDAWQTMQGIYQR